MSFGFGIGDFIAVGDLCWKLYTKVYKVSRDAPEELRGLSQELGNLSNTIAMLVEELKAEESCLARSGDARLRFVHRMVLQARETLQKMERLSKKYAGLQDRNAAGGTHGTFRILWDKLKYSSEVHSINDLRSKVLLPAHLFLLQQPMTKYSC